MVRRPCTSRMATSPDSRTLISMGKRSIMSVEPAANYFQLNEGTGLASKEYGVSANPRKTRRYIHGSKDPPLHPSPRRGKAARHYTLAARRSGKSERQVLSLRGCQELAIFS